MSTACTHIHLAVVVAAAAAAALVAQRSFAVFPYINPELVVRLAGVICCTRHGSSSSIARMNILMGIPATHNTPENECDVKLVARVPLINRKYRVPLLLLLLLLHTYNKSIYYMESRAVAIGGVRWSRAKKKVRQQRATRRDNRGGQSRGVHVRAYNYVYMCYIAYE
uniref:Secreted protein n=1 Tax=Trichogramma kaykai TaxID=54128 RepID=A0ABD2VUS1_9HYME